jgi:hypothetical protein
VDRISCRDARQAAAYRPLARRHDRVPGYRA